MAFDIAAKLTVDGGPEAARAVQQFSDQLGAMQARAAEGGLAMKTLEGYATTMKNAFIGLTGITGVGMFVDIIHGAIDAKARLYDLHLQTGMSVESLGSLGKVALYSGTPLADVAAASNKLSKALYSQNEDSKGAAAGLKALGINFDEFKALRPEEQMLKLAKALDGFEEGTGKSAVLMAQFGKNGASMAAFMKELAERGLMVTKETTEGSLRAKEFADNLITLKGAGEGLANSIASTVLPGLVALTKQLSEAQGMGAKFSVVAGNIRDNLGFSAEKMQERALKDDQMMAGSSMKGLEQLKALQASLPEWMRSTMDTAIATQQAQTARYIAAVAADSDKLKAMADKLAPLGPQAGAGRGFINPKQVIPADWNTGNEARGAAKEDPWARLIASAHGYAVEMQAQDGATRTLTEGEKKLIEIHAQLEAGTLAASKSGLELVTRYYEQGAALQSLRAMQASEKKLQDEIAGDKAKIIEDLQKETGTLEQQLKAQQDANDELRYGKGYLEAKEAATLRAMAADKESIAVTSDQSAELLKQADALRRRAAAIGEHTVLTEAKAAADEWQRTADQIGQSLSDALMQGGKSGWDYIVGLFRTMVIKVPLQAVVTSIVGGIGGAFGLSSVANAAGTAGSAASGLGGLGQLGGLLGLGSGGSFGMGVGAGLGSVFGEAGTMGGLSAGTTALGAGNIMGGMGTLAGTLAPYALGALAAYTIIKKGFGMGPKETTATGITGTVGGGEFSGMAFADWQKKGGWFRSDKHGSDTSPLDAAVAAALDTSAASVLTQTQGYAKALQLPADSLASVTMQLRIEAGKDDAATQAAIAAAFQGYQDRLTSAYAGLLEPFQKAGETLSQTFARLAGLQTFSDSLNTLGGVFSRVAGLSVDAREGFIALAGGMDALSSQAKSFAQNYYSTDELAGLKSKEIVSALAGVGITQDIASKDQFRSLVNSRDVSTEQGRTQLATLLGVSDSFAGLSDYLNANNTTLDATATLAPTSEVLGSIFTSGANAQVDATNQVRDAINRLIEIAKGNASPTSGPTMSIQPVMMGTTEVTPAWEFQSTGA